MYLHRNRRRKRGEDYDYWTLVESVRRAKGPRQRIVAHIGKEPGLDEDERLGWEQIGRLLDGLQEDEPEPQLELFAVEQPERAQAPLWAQVNLRGIRVERVRQFGKVYVALALWRRLGLHRFFQKHLISGRESVSWEQVCIGLVVTAEGLPLAYEVFDGNRADVTTVEEMVELMEKHYGVANRIWVLDRGMVSQDNLDYLCERRPATWWARLKASSKASSASCSNNPIGAKCRRAWKSNWWLLNCRYARK